jgi:hypothetical protein
MNSFTSTPRNAALIAFLLFLSATCFGQSSVSTKCLSYEPNVVTLTGTLIRKTFPGPPNYASVSRGDKPETSWLLYLSHPVCVDQDKASPALNPAHKNVNAIQLVISAEFYEKYKNLLGKQVVATGTLFGEFTGHHHTPVLLTARDMSKSESLPQRK